MANFETEQRGNYNTSESSSEESNSEDTDCNNVEKAMDSPDRDFKGSNSGTTYVKTDGSNVNCSCYCIELVLSNDTELWLS